YMGGGTNKELHKVAKRVFSITVMTAAVECLFSNMGHLHSDRRNRLDTEIDESQKKFHSENYVAPVEESEIQESEISNESFIGDIENVVQWNAVMGRWMEMLNDEKGKWKIEEIFEYNLDDPSFYQEL
ncbi:11138_t:CDS:2, partial [Entrophospora sp. SA101]